MESKRMKKIDDENQDRISGLPDHIIHHILSFLPSTKEAIQTTVLSKRWENQWTRVPVLIFNPIGMSLDKFPKFIDNTLISHDCSKINKFHIKITRKDPQFTLKVRFAVRKHVEDLYLSSILEEYMLPKFLFNHASLVQLRTVKCNFMPNAKVNWGCLTSLIMEKCNLSDQAMDHIVSGSPLLKYLGIKNCVVQKLVIASKSLKNLILIQPFKIFDVKISCPILEELNLYGFKVRNVEFLNLPSSLRAILDFYLDIGQTNTREIRKGLMKDILHQFQHVKELTIGVFLSTVLLDLECMESLMSPMLNIKCLTLDSTVLSKYCSRIPCVLNNTPMLERLVITAQFPQELQFKPNDFEENYWNSNTNVFNCLESHLKTIQIINGFPKGDDELKIVVNFVRFLLKNARVLEKMVINLKDDGTGLPLKVSQELLRLPRFSQDSIIELICSK